MLSSLEAERRRRKHEQCGHRERHRLGARRHIELHHSLHPGSTVGQVRLLRIRDRLLRRRVAAQYQPAHVQVRVSVCVSEYVCACLCV